MSTIIVILNAPLLSSFHRSLSHSPESIASFCEVLLSDFEECLNYDLQLFRDMCPACVHHVLSSGKEGGEEEGEGDHRKVEELACLPSDLLLKVVALCILSSTRLRRQGEITTTVSRENNKHLHV